MKKAYVFSGQGAQYPGMGKELYDNYDIARDIYNKANQALGFDITDICFNGSVEDLKQTEITQPAILTTSIAAYSVFIKETNALPDYVAGLSLGEYSAHVASGTLNFEDAVRLVNKRGKYMQEAVPSGKGAMYAVLGLSKNKMKDAINNNDFGDIVEVANYNTDGQIVIGGEKEACAKAAEYLKEIGAKKVVELPVSAPFHTSMLENAKIALEKELKSVTINMSRIPVITNVTGKIISKNDNIRDLLSKQVVQSVLWQDTVEEFVRLNVGTVIEFGPGKSICGFVKRISKDIKLANVENLQSIEKAIMTIKE